MFIKLTPDAEASGGGDAAVAEKVADTAVTTKAEVKAEQPKGRFLADSEYAEFERLRNESVTRAEAERKAAEEKLIEKGKWQELLDARTKERDEIAKSKVEVESRSKKHALGKELNAALASGPALVPGAAAQLSKLWAEEFEVKADGEEWRVETRDRKSPADFVREKLASDEWLHFVKADARGGAGGGGDKPTSGDTKVEKPRPGSLEDVSARWKAGQLSGGASALVMRHIK